MFKVCCLRIGWLLSAIFLVACNSSEGDPSPPNAVATAPIAVATAPIAVAGADQSVDEQTQVVLNGSVSSDTDGTLASFAWVQTAGDTITLNNATSAEASFTAPTLTTAASYTFQLTVTDNEGLSATDDVVIEVLPVNTAPVANAGSDQIVVSLDSASLDGQGVDSDGTIESFSWTQISGTPVTLSTSNSASVSFDAPDLAVDTSEVLSFRLTVIDNEGASHSGTVDVTVNASLVTGYFSYGPVAGLSYLTPTQAGVTDINGAFVYRQGERVTFSLGATILGDNIEAKTEISPFDLVPESSLITTPAQFKRIWEADGAEREAFNRVHNTLALLQALDEDKDLSNGIAIHSGVLSLMQSLELTLDEDFDGFDTDTDEIANLLYEAYNQGYIANAQMNTDGRALDHYFSAENISTYFSVPVTESQDIDGDGSVDKIITFANDAAGNQALWSTDNDANGTADSWDRWTYDAAGNNLTRERALNDGDDLVDEITTYTYDIHGNQTRREVDTVALGAPGSIDIIWAYTFNTYGKRTEDRRDTNGDGNPNWIETRSYDSNNNLTYRATDTNGDSVANRIELWTYDSNSNKLTYSNDTNADGSPEKTRANSYDANNNLLSTEYDNDGDGNPDWRDAYQYDAQGNETFELYEGLDGSYLESYSYTYDANGNTLSKLYDNLNDGVIEEKWVYTYDSQGNRLSYAEYTTDVNGDPDQVNTYTYDARGKVLTQTRDTNGDGNIDQSYRYTYNDNGLLTLYWYDSDGDGQPNIIRTTTYDADRNQLRYEADNDGDGIVDIERIWEYDQWGAKTFSSTDNDLTTPEPNSSTSYTLTPSTFYGYWKWWDD